MSDLDLVGIVGSLRAGSVNGAVARAAAAATGPGVALSLLDVRAVPLYDGDVERAGLPPAVDELHDRVAACDGLVFFSPEYNSSFPAVTKNAIDWLTRPPRSWEGTAVTLVVATPGPRAGLGLRTHFSAIMSRQPVRLFEPIGLGEYRQRLDDRGEVGDEATIAELADFLGGFAEFCRTPA